MTKPGPTPIPPVDRFWLNVKRGPSETCWPWEGPRNDRGYGMLHDAGRRGYKRVRAHRFAYELLVGPIPAGRLVCHHCDNPPCCNPNHLYAGTPGDNTRDARDRGRLNYEHFVGERNPNVRLTSELAAKMRAEYRRGVLGFGYVALGRRYGVHANTVRSVIIGETWSAA